MLPTIAQQRVLTRRKTGGLAPARNTARRESVVVSVTIPVGGLAGGWIQEQSVVAGMAEVEHVEQRSRAVIGRSAADPAHAPVVLNETQDGRLVSQSAVHKVSLGIRRDYEQQQARPARVKVRFAWLVGCYWIGSEIVVERNILLENHNHVFDGSGRLVFQFVAGKCRACGHQGQEP